MTAHATSWRAREGGGAVMLQLCVNCDMLLDVQQPGWSLRSGRSPVPTDAVKSYESQSDKGRARETTRLLLLDDTSDMYNTTGTALR